MDISSLAASASAVKQATNQNKIATAVATKTLNVQRQQGEAVVALINQAAQVTPNANARGLDIRG